MGKAGKKRPPDQDAQAKAESGQKQKASKARLTTTVDNSINDALYAKVGKAWSQITEMLPDLPTEEPLPVTTTRGGMRGMIEPFDKGALVAAMKKPDSTYTCGINMAWLHSMFTPCPGVPINLKHVENLRKLIDDWYPDTITVALEPGKIEATPQPWNWKATSPEELRHAYVIHIGEDLQGNPKNLPKWHRCLLSVQCQFKFASETTMLLQNRESREKIRILSDNMRRTAFASIFEIFAYKTVLENAKGGSIPQSKIAAAYSQLRMADTSEPVSETFVQVSLMVHGLLMKNPTIKTILMTIDGHVQNPINSVHKIRELMVKADKDLACNSLIRLAYAF